MAFGLAGLQALVWIPQSIATVILGLRMFVRLRTRNIKIEDYLMMVSWLFLVVTAGLAEANLEATDPLQAGKYLYAALLLGIISLSSGKTSITIVLLRLLERTALWRKRYLYGTLVTFILSSIACFVVNVIGSCATQRPPDLTPFCLHYSGKIQAAFVLIWSLLGALLDISYSVLAWSLLWPSHLGRAKKAGLYVLFGLGWVAAPFSILRPIASGAVFGNKDIFWLSTSLEIALVVIGGSVSFLMPLFDFVVHGKPLTPQYRYPQPFGFGNSDTAVKHSHEQRWNNKQGLSKSDYTHWDSIRLTSLTSLPVSGRRRQSEV